MRARYPERQDATFAPTRELARGERLEVGGCTLRVLHTPGHASNQLCFLDERERLLFTGDHLMQGSTVVINPPDGDMATYLASLRLLLAEQLDFIAPGHGPDGPAARDGRARAGTASRARTSSSRTGCERACDARRSRPAGLRRRRRA
jgi:glyoxylase-like metal-dependent hydrolase (beta-lactamase superfamily II)